jgi:2-haloacid dehalogenase
VSTKLVTYDVYMALLDIEGSLVPVVQETLSLDTDIATAFVRLWRTKQMERAAISNSLEKSRTSFRECSAMALDYCLGRHNLAPVPDIRRDLVFAWDTMNPWADADSAKLMFELVRSSPIKIISINFLEVVEKYNRP